jgi:hypothetical protein
MKDNFKELLIVAALIILLVALFVFNSAICSNPLMETAILVLIGTFVVLFIGFVWKEYSRDEREKLHKYIASRFAYLAGILILTLGVILQTIQNHLDIWLVISLCVMLLLKMVGIIYSKFKH